MNRLFSLTAIAVQLSIQLNAQPVQSHDAKCRELTDLLRYFARQTNTQRISREEQNRFVVLLADVETEPPYLSDSAYNALYPAIDALSKAAKRDTNCIRTLLDLVPVMRNNAEFSESLPCYTQAAVRANPEGFIHMLLKMREPERQKVLDFLQWECETKFAGAFLAVAKSSRDSTVRDIAKWLSKVYEQY